MYVHAQDMHVCAHVSLKIILSIWKLDIYASKVEHICASSQNTFSSCAIRIPLFVSFDLLQMLAIYHRGAELSMEVCQHKHVRPSAQHSDRPGQGVSSCSSPSKDQSITVLPDTVLLYP